MSLHMVLNEEHAQDIFLPRKGHQIMDAGTSIDC